MNLNTSIDPRDEARLGKQCEAILARLQEGPATSYELAQIALKYTSRISDLRKSGHVVIGKRDVAGFVYTLIAS